MKVIKIEGCNTCPYIKTKVNFHKQDKGCDTKKHCSAIEDDDIHYSEDMFDYVKNRMYPIWCPLEELE